MSNAPEIRADVTEFPAFLADRYLCESCLKWNEEESTWLCRDRESQAFVLIKTAAEETAVRCLRNEYELLRLIAEDASPAARSFPRAIGLTEEPGGLTALIREHLPGRTLESLVEAPASRPGLAPETAVRMILDVLDQLDFLHRLQPPVIHRDIKPQNVVVDPLGRCHLIDLGASRMSRGGADTDTVVMGTRLTSPPEQYGYQSTDARSDIYSTGILLRYCLTGAYDDSEDASIPPALRQIVQKATRFDPKDRYQQVAAFQKDLRAAQKQAEPSSRARSRRALLPAAAALLAVGFLLGRLTAPGLPPENSTLPTETAAGLPAAGTAIPGTAPARDVQEAAPTAAGTAPESSVPSGDAKSPVPAAGTILPGTFSQDPPSSSPSAARPELEITEAMFDGDQELYASFLKEEFIDCTVAIYPDGLHFVRYITFLEERQPGKPADRSPLSAEELSGYLSALQRSPLWAHGLNLLILDRTLESLEPFRIKYLSPYICLEFHNCALPADPEPLSALMPYCINLACYNCAPVSWKSLDFLRTANYVDVLDLTFDGTAEVDLSVLKVMESPRILRLTNATISPEILEAIGRMTALETLCLPNCGLTDVTPLGSLSRLQDLNLNMNQITDLSPVEKLPALQSLTADLNPATRGQ